MDIFNCMSKVNKRLTLAIIGCGRVSPKHFNAVLKNEFFSLKACCDLNPDVCKKVSKKYPALSVYSSYEKLLNESNVDLVVITTPSGLHAEMAIKALEAGKDVVLEKPVALTVADALRIKESAVKNNRQVTVMLQNRLNKVVDYTKKYSQKLGRLNYISANVFWYRPQEYYEDGWHGTKEMDGGALMNQGTHYVDMMLYLSEKKIKQISAFGSTLKHNMECEDVITINVRFKDDSLGNIQVNTFSYPKNVEGSITLFYDLATIKIGGLAMNKIEYWLGEGENELPVIDDEIDSVYGNGHDYFYEQLSEYYQGKINSLPASLEDGIQALQFIEAAYLSSSKNCLIYV